jgi:hypothetical protein
MHFLSVPLTLQIFYHIFCAIGTQNTSDLGCKFTSIGCLKILLSAFNIFSFFCRVRPVGCLRKNLRRSFTSQNTKFLFHITLNLYAETAVKILDNSHTRLMYALWASSPIFPFSRLFHPLRPSLKMSSMYFTGAYWIISPCVLW